MFLNSLINLLILSLIVQTKSETSNPCFLDAPKKQDFIYSDLNLIRTVYKPFTHYSTIDASYIEANLISDYLFANFCVNAIDLSGNKIESISTNAFKGILYINWIYLDSNRIKSIDDFIANFDSTSLTKLYLTNNKIEKIGRKFTSFFANLRELYLTSNSIELIGDGIFENLISLETLLINWNKVKILENFTFSNLINLKNLDLSYNLISDIKDTAFSDLNNLMFLFLNKNKLKSVRNITFSRTPNLFQLILDSNMISEVQSGSFSNLRYLSYLELSNNDTYREQSQSGGRRNFFLSLSFNLL